MLPEAVDGHERGAWASSATPRPCTGRAGGPAGASRSPASSWLTALGARPSEVDLHRRWHRGRQPGRQGHLLGPPRRRPAPSPRAGQRGRAPRRPRRGRVAGRARRCRGHLAAGRRARPSSQPDDAARGARPTTRTASRWSRSCGRTTRSARSSRSPSWPRSPTSTASRCTPTRCRPSARVAGRLRRLRGGRADA